MTATPLADLLAAVPSLNDPQQPFTYAVDGHKIVGTWDIVKATSLYPTEVTHIDKGYRLEVELDEDEHSYDYEDHESETSATLDGDGLHLSQGAFKGKTKKKEFYSFDTDRIKDPLFGFLEQHGWEKKGFFKKLFS